MAAENATVKLPPAPAPTKPRKPTVRQHDNPLDAIVDKSTDSLYYSIIATLRPSNHFIPFVHSMLSDCSLEAVYSRSNAKSKALWPPSSEQVRQICVLIARGICK
eukprot:TRINITY_DN71578_c0_g1_i1.p2 TRINITY_DN71578_c0_g1~~TRINITY_DN71578_c0_g1_i1.p2  ORF type:complete len:105 (-),score=11.98 TRINITY_DN71578_c0_g1_i1:812-1126(-)